MHSAELGYHDQIEITTGGAPDVNFAKQLAEKLGVAAEPTPWPELNEDELSALTEQYSSPEWMGAR